MIKDIATFTENEVWGDFLNTIRPFITTWLQDGPIFVGVSQLQKQPVALLKMSNYEDFVNNMLFFPDMVNANLFKYVHIELIHDIVLRVHIQYYKNNSGVGETILYIVPIKEKL